MDTTIIEEKRIKEKGYNLHLIPNEKHKTINFVFKWIAPLERGTITTRAILPYVLQQGTNKYPSSRELQLKLDDLYGAVLSIDSAKKGNNHVLSFRLEVANELFIPDESSIIEDAIQLLKEVIFEPRSEGASFHKQTFNREKETLNQKIDAIIDDKMSYANMRLMDEMCVNESYGLHVHGYKEDLASLTANDAYAYYRRLLTEDQLEIYVSGDYNEEDMQTKLKTIFDREPSRVKDEKDETSKTVSKTNVVIEKQNIQQAKLHIGYRTNTTFKDDDYFALVVFNGLLGGFPSSKLFINVREKNSLAYYAASMIESHKGLLFIFSGIASSDYEQAREIIEQQMKAMKLGDFTDDELKETKDLIINQFLETLDSPQGIIELLFQQVIGNKVLKPSELLESVQKVTKDDVIKVGEKVIEDTVYLLTSKEESKDE